LYQAERLQEELNQRGAKAQVLATPDLWDLPADFQTVVYPAPRGGERSLKIDMVEQAVHILRPGGRLVVWSSYHPDQFFSPLLKKVFGKVHAYPVAEGTAFWCRREGDRPRRRHEVTFQVRAPVGPPLLFLSRPGVFSYGRFDEGARALVETMQVSPGDRILDLGCGCGTNGTWAGRLAGPAGSVTFVDSNVRAVALAELNARANGLTLFQTVAASRVEGLTSASFDVALLNPPYYAQHAIARRLTEHCRGLLRPGGRFYLVTKQADQVGPIVAESFGRHEVVARRGYAVLSAIAPAGQEIGDSSQRK
jgi:16S rRNA (guanine1207-N2)-methyltransferase